MTSLANRIPRGTPDDPILLTPEGFEAFARMNHWPPAAIALLCKPPYSPEPFMCADGTKPGKWIRIVEPPCSSASGSESQAGS